MKLFEISRKISVILKMLVVIIPDIFLECEFLIPVDEIEMFSLKRYCINNMACVP